MSNCPWNGDHVRPRPALRGLEAPPAGLGGSFQEQPKGEAKPVCQPGLQPRVRSVQIDVGNSPRAPGRGGGGA